MSPHTEWPTTNGSDESRRARLAIERALLLLREDRLLGQDAVAGWSEQDWRETVDTATLQGLGPLLYDRLLRHGLAAPRDQLDRLRLVYLHTAAANLRRLKELEQVLAALEGAGLRAVLLKGAYLATAVYASEALRPMVDIDLLLPEPEISESLRVLATLGFQLPRGADWMGERFAHYGLRHAITGTYLEVHGRLVPDDRTAQIDHEALWSRLLQVRLGAHDAWTLDPMDHILHVCLHASTHHLFRMGPLPLYDLAALYSTYREEIDEDLLAESARAWGAERATCLCLTLARDMAGASVPESTLQLLGAGNLSEALLADVRGLLLGGPVRGEPLSPNVLALWTARGLWSRLGVWQRILFPSATRMRALYALPPDRSLMPWHYVRRLRDLVVERGQSLRQLKGVRGDGPYKELARWLAEG